MRRLTLFLSLAALLLAAALVLGWETKNLGGGNLEKMLTYENENGSVKGMWGFDKDGGACWYQYDSNDNTWDDPQYFNTNYAWHMGGDVDSAVDIGGTVYPAALNVTFKGHHIYKYVTSPSAGWVENDQTFPNNAYYTYHDAQFFGMDGSNTLKTTHFLVSTWNWQPTVSTYKRGIYLVTTGAAPGPSAVPIADNISQESTVDRTYSKLYRSIDPSANNRDIYTWYSDANRAYFQKIHVNGNSPYTFTISNDFMGVNLDEINAFYQYKDSDNGLHQYLLGKEDGNTYLSVWHRSDLGDDDWGDPIWENVEGDIAGGVEGLSAREYDHTNDYHYIYTNALRSGLVIYDTQSASAQIFPLQPDNAARAAQEISGFTLLPASWTPNGGCDRLIVSTEEYGCLYLTLDPANQEIKIVQIIYPDSKAALPFHTASLRPSDYFFDNFSPAPTHSEAAPDK